MYCEDIYVFPESVEHEIKCAGRYGAKGEKRGARKKATPEQIKRQNQNRRENSVRRLIKANFTPRDIWATLKYPAGTKITPDTIIKHMGNFLKRLRRIYRKHACELKYIYRIEVGKNGGPHIHMLVNRIPGADTDIIIQEAWEHGRINYTNVYRKGGYKQLADYIVKLPDEEVEKQMSLFPENERKTFIKYSSSRNLVRPQPERKYYKRRNIRRLVTDGPTPREGYYIDKSTVYYGTNPYNGMTYYRYTEVLISPETFNEDYGGITDDNG